MKLHVTLLFSAIIGFALYYLPGIIILAAIFQDWSFLFKGTLLTLVYSVPALLKVIKPYIK